MSPLPGNEGERSIVEPATDISCAREILSAQSADVQATLAASATQENLAKISRYVKEKEIPEISYSWLCSVQLHPLCFDAGENVVVFGNRTRDGFNLPSHVPGIVFRKLVVRVYVSLKHKRVEKVVVSIRGWCEE